MARPVRDSSGNEDRRSGGDGERGAGSADADRTLGALALTARDGTARRLLFELRDCGRFVIEHPDVIASVLDCSFFEIVRQIIGIDKNDALKFSSSSGKPVPRVAKARTCGGHWE
jgi:hypothetical protein